MIRTRLHRGIVTAAVVAIAAGTVLAYEKPILRGVSSEYGPQYGKKLVIRKNVGENTRPPGGQIPGEPIDKPKPVSPMGGLRDNVLSPGGGSEGGSAGVGMIASASPQTRLEQRLKDLARELR